MAPYGIRDGLEVRGRGEEGTRAVNNGGARDLGHHQRKEGGGVREYDGMCVCVWGGAYTPPHRLHGAKAFPVLCKLAAGSRCFH